MIRRRAELARVDRALVGMVDQVGFGQDRRRDAAARLDGEGFRSQEPLGFGVAQAGFDAFDRRVGVEGQPGGADLGDGDLADQQFRPARPPKPDHVAGADLAPHQTSRQGRGLAIDLGIGELALHRAHGDGMRAAGGGRSENLGEQFVAHQVGTEGAAQDRKGVRWTRSGGSHFRR